MGAYSYADGAAQLTISLMYSAGGDSQYYSSADGDLIEYSDRKICIYQSTSSEGYTAEIYTEDGTMTVEGASDRNVALKISKGLKKQ